jgi:glutaminyl-tRNA synthetase
MAGLLRAGMLLTCTNKEKDGSLTATIRPRGDAKPKGNLHWVSEGHAVEAELRLYNNLFTVDNPMAPVAAPAAAGKADEAAVVAVEDEEDDKDDSAPAWLSLLNPDSLKVEAKALIEPSLAKAAANPGTAFQFQRVGFFVVDLDSTAKKPVFNRTVPLK